MWRQSCRYRRRLLPFRSGGGGCLCSVWRDSRLGRRSRCPILRNCRLAMNQKGRLLLVEVVVPDDDAHCFSKLLDLNMMVMTGGRERTRAEFAALLNTAGYS